MELDLPGVLWAQYWNIPVAEERWIRRPDHGEKIHYRSKMRAGKLQVVGISTG
ncbi:MAG: hypothetical protein WHX93_01110 [bacterium]